MRHDVSFLSEGERCVGWLYVPDSLVEGAQAPAIVMANAVSAVKEITLHGYAERFAAAGFIVLAFDYRHYGSSEGEPRNHIVPFAQQQDIRNAISYLGTLPQVDKNHIGGWGVSLGGAHFLHLGAYDRRLKAVVTVATGLNAFEAMMGHDGVVGFLSMLASSRDAQYHDNLPPTYIPAVSLAGQGGMMAFQEAYDFYTDAMNTYAPTYDNRVTLESLEYFIAYDAATAMSLISPTALLMVHGEKDLIPPAMIREVFARASEPKKLVIYDCTHTDLYVREPWLTQSADEAIAWYNTYLRPSVG